MKQLSDHNLDHQGEPMAGNESGSHTISITSMEVRKVRKGLSLTVEHFALLLGVSPSTIFRYENIGVNAFHQGPVARKLCLLHSWIGEEGRSDKLRTLLAGQGGLAILAGLLETGSVLIGNLPFESYAVTPGGGDASGVALPTAESLAESINRAFHQTDSRMNQAKAAPVEDGDDMASRIETEARIMEAEARKLEAQARKLEAMVRIRQAEGSVTNG
jgi:transcriptional regulator with XRE-family HTH domain